ncbi:Cupin 2 conserved barrel domain protein [Hymenobacter roseosalivarius DSM 11622]|uniref:Cupin 2 conserved barrel domain protein n=1 Tax=Hymenobacter roseosalivarius DSM 11622 TaxID=645990 RepID=A0A1W1VEF5_9BACT|nr:cupin domain-containing protein [Hymenobacter roseosalivarius]SMB91779.1 Cupin 2 conserved barrel domain protein [Hymenobacter roseosalivarius DSM 11622]
MEPINLNQKFAQFHDHWNPRIIGELNDQHIKIAKVQGEFIWHSHQHEDELFIVVQGTLLMDFRDKTVALRPGELLVVPKGVEHRPRTEGETWIMMIEPKTTLNTGNVENERTRKELEVL